MSQQGILERGIGQRMLVVLALLIVIGAGVFAATRPANALGTDITVVGMDTAQIVGAGVAPNVAIPAGLFSESKNPTLSGGLIIQTGSPAGTLYRTPAIGGIVEINAILTGDVTIGPPLDIVTTTVSLGGLNSLTGPSSIVSNNVNGPAVTPGATITVLAALAPTIVMVAATDAHVFSLFAQGVPGTATVTVTAGGQTGDDTQGVGGAVPSVIFVGVASTLTAGSASAVGVGVPASLVNPTAFPAGSATSASGALTGGLQEHFYAYIATDSNGQEVLDGQVVNLALTNITGGAVITATMGTNAGAAAALVSGTTLNEPALAGAPGMAAPLAANHGAIFLGITTTAGTPAGGTLTVSVIGFGATAITTDFVANGAGAALAINAPAAADASGNAGANFIATGEATFIVTLTDAAGSAVSGSSGANIATIGSISFAQPAGGALLVSGVGGATAALAGVAIRAALPGAATAILPAVGLAEIGNTGTYSLGLTTAAGAAAGAHAFTLSLTVGLVVVDTLAGTFTVSGAVASSSVTSIVDGAGVSVIDAPSAGVGELLIITVTWLDALGNPVGNGSTPGPAAGPAPLVSIGTLTANTASNDAGSTTHTFIAGAASGISTFTAVLGAVTEQFTIEVGGSGGGVIDGLVAADSLTTIAGTVGVPVQLTVNATINGVATANAIVLFESGSVTPTPSLPSSNAAGEASTFVSSATAGTFIVTATAVTEGGVSQIPVAGIDTVIFTITFSDPAATSVDLSTGAVSTYTGWSGTPISSSAFNDLANLTIVWFWDGAAWLSYVPGAIVALQADFEVSTNDVLFIVTTGAVSVPLS